MNDKIELVCCVCRKLIGRDERDVYILQVRKVGMPTPEMMWSHGPCIRTAIPVIAEEIPN
jgi:hypothetical protein